jgi:hypothetical protein
MMSTKGGDEVIEKATIAQGQCNDPCSNFFPTSIGRIAIPFLIGEQVRGGEQGTGGSYLTKNTVHKIAVIDRTALENCLFDSLRNDVLEINHALFDERLDRREAYEVVMEAKMIHVSDDLPQVHQSE